MLEIVAFNLYVCNLFKAAKRGILSSGRGRGIHSRGRGAAHGRGRGRGRGRSVPGHAVVDHRPRALEISAFTESDREDLLPHFAVLSYCPTEQVLIVIVGNNEY